MRLPSSKHEIMGYCLVAAGSILLLTSFSLKPSGRILAPEFDLSQLSLANSGLSVESYLPIRIYNPNRTSVCIVGYQGAGCGPGGCVYGLEPETLNLAPGETRDVFVHYKSPPVPGPFEKEFIIYTSTNVLNEHKLKVTGVAVGAKKKQTVLTSKDTKAKSHGKSDALVQDD